MAQQQQTMAMSDFNLVKISTVELSRHLEASIQMGENIAVFGQRGSGKMLDLETELPTPTGLIKLKDLKVGDQLFDENGDVCNVVQLHPIDLSPESYKITFDDKTTVNACADHLWFTWDKKARNGYGGPAVRNTKQILKTLKTNTKKVETNHSIRNAYPAKYSAKELPIDPYVLGCWLGDGSSNVGHIECAEKEILHEIKAAGYSINKIKSSCKCKSKSRAYRIGDLVDNKPHAKIGLLRKQLDSLNLLNNKHIPEIYIQSSYEQRLALLQGLLDTDGCCDKKKNRIEFCSVIPKLAEQTALLANSLGIKTFICKNKSALYGKPCKDRYRICFITKLPVFRLKRKLKNLKKTKAQDNRNTHRYIINIEKISPVPMRCITVDSPSHLYLITKSFIATHNTVISRYEINRSKMHEVYLNLSVFERVDLGGYPNIMAANQQKKFVDFLLPQFYASMIEGKQGVVALLDEVDKADPSIWAPLLEFTQFRSINGNPLPNLKSVIMTGNLISEGGSRPSLPLLDRAEKYLLEPDSKSWLDWAGRTNSVHPSIVSYITDNPKDLFGKTDPEDRYADPSPRGWSRASEILFKGEEFGYDSELLNKKVAGCIGKGVGLKYSNYYEHYRQLLPMIDDIFKGKDVSSVYAPLEPTKKLVACMIACVRLANDLDQVKGKELPPSVGFVGKFLQKISYENILIAVRSQINVDRIVKFNLDEAPYWSDLLSSVSKYIDQ